MRMLRNATIRGRSGIFAAISGLLLASCPSASPMISNWRSTADLNSKSYEKSSKVFPWVKVVIAAAA